jgi:hypothetical protein
MTLCLVALAMLVVDPVVHTKGKRKGQRSVSRGRIHDDEVEVEGEPAVQIAN